MIKALSMSYWLTLVVTFLETIKSVRCPAGLSWPQSSSSCGFWALQNNNVISLEYVATAASGFIDYLFQAEGTDGSYFNVSPVVFFGN